MTATDEQLLRLILLKGTYNNTFSVFKTINATVYITDNSETPI